MRCLSPVIEHDPADQRAQDHDRGRIGRKDEGGVRTQGSHAPLRLHDAHRSDAAAQNLVAHRRQMQRQEQQKERQRHHQQRIEQGRIDRGSAHADHRSRLVQRVPPIDRELDDRQIDGADQDQDGGAARAPVRILRGRSTARSRRGRAGTARAPRSAAHPTPNRRPTSAGPTASR